MGSLLCRSSCRAWILVESLSCLLFHSSEVLLDPDQGRIGLQSARRSRRSRRASQPLPPLRTPPKRRTWWWVHTDFLLPIDSEPPFVVCILLVNTPHETHFRPP